MWLTAKKCSVMEVISMALKASRYKKFTDGLNLVKIIKVYRWLKFGENYDVLDLVEVK